MWTDKVFGPEYLAAESQSGVSARLYRRLAENSLGLMCCHDLDGVLLWINPVAASSLGYPAEQVIGTRLDKFLAPEVRSQFDLYLHRIRRAGVDSGLMRVKAKQGDERIWMYRNVISDDPELPPHVLGHALDVTEHFRAERALRDLFERTPMAQMELDATGKLCRINRAGCRILGYSRQEILSAEGRSHIADLLKRSSLAGETPELLSFTRKDGRELHLEVCATHMTETGSSSPVIICGLIDASDRIRAEMEIRNLNARLEARVNTRTAELRRSNAELEQFACIASHDLRAPLKGVGIVLEELESKSADKDTSDLLRLCRGDIQRMSTLVECLLEYAVVSNRAEIVSPQVHLTTAVQQSLMNLASAVAECGAVVTYENLPQILVPESDFIQVFQNLIGNALKYRGREVPEIHISAAKTNEFWIISVSDNGIGIEPAYSERIFQAFQRLHGKEYDGSGMGLAICKKIVERAGGRIWVESERGRGSSFRFTLPS